MGGVGIAAALLVGCGDSANAAGNGTARPSGPPPDEVSAGELVKSGDQAFGLALPRGLRVARREFNLVVAEGSVPLDEALAYLRAESTFLEEVQEIPSVTSFKRVVPKRRLNDWKGLIRIDASGDDKFTSLRIFGDATPRRPKQSAPSPSAPPTPGPT